MTTCTNKSRSGRSGFTLVELLVAITVIAILLGMLTASVIPVLTRAKEMTIITQMKQVEQSLENFKNDYGMYPPSWRSLTWDAGTMSNYTPVQSATRLLRYLNRISPNHREGQIVSGTQRRVDDWWNSVGRLIDPEHGDDLVFWLSGLSKNPQYPLTNSAVWTPAPAFNDGSFGRQVYFEFPTGQLDIHDGVVASFQQQAGVNANWLYIDHNTYGNGSGFDGYYVLNTDPGLTHANGSSTLFFENPNRFQLICPGMDKDIGPSTVRGQPSGQWAEQRSIGFEGLVNLIDQGVGSSRATADNITNITDGRLSMLTEGIQESSAVKY